jgi:uncharacterized cupin superfamily protein
MRAMRHVSLSAAQFTYDEQDPPGFRSGMFRVGREVGAEQTGASVYELPPGEVLCPYHYEYAEEEWLLVLEGRPSVRTPEATEQLEPLELVFFPRGPAGAHQVRNDTDAPARVLMFSTVIHPSATAYPDSGKVGVWTGDKQEDLIVERASAVDYYHGEGGAPSGE